MACMVVHLALRLLLSDNKAAKYPLLRGKRGIARCSRKILGIIYKALYFVSITQLCNIFIVKLLNMLYKTNLHVYFALHYRFALELKRC
jgi:hypothetical protein